MKLRYAALGAISLLICAAPAEAAVTFTFAQVGANVVLTGAGNLNLTGASIVCCGTQDGYLNPSSGGLAVGGPFGNVSFITLTSRDGAFGTSGYRDGTPDSGDRIGMNALDGAGYINVFEGYASGATLFGTTTFANQTIASLGLTAGTYVYRIPNDSVTVVVPGGVPEPATWAMMLLGFGAIGFAMRRKPKVSLRVRFV